MTEYATHSNQPPPLLTCAECGFQSSERKDWAGSRKILDGLDICRKCNGNHEYHNGNVQLTSKGPPPWAGRGAVS